MNKNNLKKYRIRAGYTQKEVAHLLGLSSSNRISEWENEESLPNINNLFRLSIIYKTTPQMLYHKVMKAERIVTKIRKRNLFKRITSESKVFIENTNPDFEPSDLQKTIEEQLQELAEILFESILWEHKYVKDKNPG